MRLNLAVLAMTLAMGSPHAQDDKNQRGAREQRAEIVYCERATRDLKSANQGMGQPLEPKAVLEARVKGCIAILETYRDQEAQRLLEMAR
jgi:hypothetical protein